MLCPAKGLPEVAFIAHSMGCLLLARCLATNPLDGSRRSCHKLVYAAADVDQKEFQGFVQAARGGQQREFTVLLTSGIDVALGLSSLYHSVRTRLPTSLRGFAVGASSLRRVFSDRQVSRAGRCHSSYCFDPQHFTTIQCTGCEDQRGLVRVHHGYLFVSGAIAQDLEDSFAGNEPSTRVDPGCASPLSEYHGRQTVNNSGAMQDVDCYELKD